MLMDGGHPLERCFEVAAEVLRTVFSQLYTQRVALAGMILKPNMVRPGLDCPKQDSVEEAADATGGVFCEPFPLPFRGLRSCRAANPVNWPRPV
jgi:fructose-bisphosphate aldolase class I